MDHVDVLIVGAGLSGIGVACHLRARCPEKTFAVLESRAASGGTWDLFRYPGVRSDSDMYTLGYRFAPWEEAKALADGPSILRYLRDTAARHGVDRHIAYHRRAVAASWSTDDGRWTVDVLRTDSGETEQVTSSFLWGATGYYRYDHGHRPEFPGEDGFAGTVVHPQAWPEGLAWRGARIVVIGSGATAVTLVPALARGGAAHVTMLQRSPTYIVSRPTGDRLADALRHLLPPRVAYPLIRAKNVTATQLSYRVSRRWPEFAKRGIRKGVEQALPDGFDVATHFSPPYDPWDQRLCLAADGDLFEELTAGRVSMVTGTIDTFTEHGIRLTTGEVLAADLVVTATGLELQFLGGMALEVDGRKVDVAGTVGFRGIMLCGVPNLAVTFGYTNASWTLKADLTADYVCRLLHELDRRHLRQATPLAPDPSLPVEPFLDFTSGYVRRAVAELPKQGATPPWRLHQNYVRDALELRLGRVGRGLALSNPV